MADSLEFAPSLRKGERFSDGGYKTERHFLDVLVSRQSLWQLLGKPKDMVSAFCPDFDISGSITSFLLEADNESPGTRRALFICPECGDFECGAITVVVERSDDRIVWRDFGYENGYEPPIFDRYKEVGPFEFDREYYCAALKAINKGG